MPTRDKVHVLTSISIYLALVHVPAFHKATRPVHCANGVTVRHGQPITWPARCFNGLTRSQRSIATQSAMLSQWVEVRIFYINMACGFTEGKRAMPSSARIAIKRSAART